MDTIQALLTRKSVRSYSTQAVEEEKMAQIIKVGNQAPVAGVFQISVIRNKKLLQQINDATLQAMKDSGNDFLMSRANMEGYQPLYGAPVLTVLSAPPVGYYQINAACAATNMVNAATALGLGSCFVVSPTLVLDGVNELSQASGIPAGNKPVCAVLIGYAASDQFQSQRTPVENVNYVD